MQSTLISSYVKIKYVKSNTKIILKNKILYTTKKIKHILKQNF